jgi:hypothetical protein
LWRKKSRQWGAIRGVRRVPHPPRHRSRRSGVRRFGAYTRGTLGAARVLPSSGRGVRGTKREGEGSVKSVTALVTSLVCLIHPGKFRAPLRSSSRSRTFVWSIRAGAVRPGCRLSPARLPRFPPGVPVFAVPSRPRLGTRPRFGAGDEILIRNREAGLETRPTWVILRGVGFRSLQQGVL